MVRDRLQVWLRAHPLLALMVLAVIIHAPFTGGGLLTDDFLHFERLDSQTLDRVLVSPDTFGFYRPIPQATLLMTLRVTGVNPRAMRVVNILIHAAVICAAYVVARLLLGSGPGAWLATLAFILTPKAHPVAVLWISARAELLMALFSLVAVIGWIRWDGGAGRRWLAVAACSYVLALLCKETAVLLPLLLLSTPLDSPYPSAARLGAVAGMLGAAALLVLWRVQIGALMPISTDPHYDLTTPLRRWFRNGRNYFWRAVVSPIALVVTMGAARAATGRPRGARPAPPRLMRLAFFAAGWFAVLILPVLPIASRSEHYLYLPVFGLCVLAGGIADALFPNGRRPDVRWAAALALYVLVLGGFQVSRASALHADAVFSARFVAAIQQDPFIAPHRGSVTFVPADERTRRFLQDAIGGYIATAVNRALGRQVPAGVATADAPAAPDALLLEFVYADDRVILRPLR